MKKAFIPAIILLIIIADSCKTKQAVAVNERTASAEYFVNFVEPTTWILGYFTRERMAIPPHSEWYTEGYEKYRPDNTAVEILKKINSTGLTITIVLGTWCPDSRREVPRFLKILDLTDFPAEKITFIGTDNQKLSPVGEYEKLDIQRVPTFIFFKNKIETGRIIEVPLTSLEQDMVNILAKE